MSAGRPAGPPLGPAPATRYLILTLGGLRLLLPQDQVYALEPAFDVAHPAGDDLGRIRVDGLSWPVCCLSEELKPVREIPASRHVCVLLHAAAGLFGVLCDRVLLSEGPGGPDILPLPECMRTPHTRLRGLALQGGQVLCVTSVGDLLACAGVGQDPPARSVAGKLVPGRTP